MDRKIRLKIRLDHEHTAKDLSANEWVPAVPPGANATEVDVERTFANDDDFVQAMAMIRKGSFLVLEATQETSTTPSTVWTPLASSLVPRKRWWVPLSASCQRPGRPKAGRPKRRRRPRSPSLRKPLRLLRPSSPKK